MGAGKRIIYNELIMNKACYGNKQNLIILFKNYYLLEDLCNCGDQVAMSIRLDLKAMVGKANSCGFITPLNSSESSVLIDYYIYGFTQQELSKKYHISQMAISNRVLKSIDKLSEFWEVYDE